MKREADEPLRRIREAAARGAEPGDLLEGVGVDAEDRPRIARAGVEVEIAVLAAEQDAGEIVRIDAGHVAHPRLAVLAHGRGDRTGGCRRPKALTSLSTK